MKAKSEKFPVSIQRGSSVVKIYRDQTKTSGTYFRVSFYKGGKRCGLNFADLDDAKKEAEKKAAQLSRGDLEALQLTGKDRLIYGRALEAIRSLDIPLDTAAQEFADAKKALGGFSLSEAVQFFMRHHTWLFFGRRFRFIASVCAALRISVLSFFSTATMMFSINCSSLMAASSSVPIRVCFGSADMRKATFFARFQAFQRA